MPRVITNKYKRGHIVLSEYGEGDVVTGKYVDPTGNKDWTYDYSNGKWIGYKAGKSFDISKYQSSVDILNKAYNSNAPKPGPYAPKQGPTAPVKQQQPAPGVVDFGLSKYKEQNPNQVINQQPVQSTIPTNSIGVPKFTPPVETNSIGIPQYNGQAIKPKVNTPKVEVKPPGQYNIVGTDANQFDKPPQQVAPSPVKTNKGDMSSTTPPKTTTGPEVYTQFPPTIGNITKNMAASVVNKDLPGDIKTMLQTKEQNPSFAKMEKNFYVYSKENSTFYVFDKNHHVIDKIVSGRGVQKGDQLNTVDIDLPLTGQNRKNATTPGGNFAIQSVDNDPETLKDYGNPVYSLGMNEKTGKWNPAIHDVYVAEEEARMKILNDPDIKEKLLSYGCVNVPKGFLSKPQNTPSVGDSVFVTKEPGAGYAMGGRVKPVNNINPSVYGEGDTVTDGWLDTLDTNNGKIEDPKPKPKSTPIITNDPKVWEANQDSLTEYTYGEKNYQNFLNLSKQDNEDVIGLPLNSKFYGFRAQPITLEEYLNAPQTHQRSNTRNYPYVAYGHTDDGEVVGRYKKPVDMIYQPKSTPIPVTTTPDLLPQKTQQEVVKPISNTLPKPKQSVVVDYQPGYYGGSPYGTINVPGGYTRAATYQEYIKHGSQSNAHLINSKTGEMSDGSFAPKLKMGGTIPQYALGSVVGDPTKPWSPTNLDGYNIQNPVTPNDSLAHQAGKTMDYEFTKGSPTGTGLPDYGYHQSQLPQNQVPSNWTPPTNKQDAVSLYMKELAPRLTSWSSAIEKGEAGDFLYNTGRDPRVYQLDQYLKSIGQSGLTNRGSYNIDTKTPQWTPELQASLDTEWNKYSKDINKLPENQRRILMNKGRDFYYQNINKNPDGSPNDAYKNTWYGRIWNTNKFKNGGRIDKYPAHGFADGDVVPMFKQGDVVGDGWLNTKLKKYELAGEVKPENYKVNLQPYNIEQSSSTAVRTPETNLSLTDFITKRIIEGDQVNAFPQTKVTNSSLVSNYENTEKSNLQEVMSKEKYYKKYNTTNKADVTKLQTMLTSNGYKLPKYGIDGYFGDETKKSFDAYIADKQKKVSKFDFSEEESKKTCDKPGCAEYVSNLVNNTVLGDAWEMESNMVKDGKKIKYNIYTDPKFQNVTTTQELIKVTKEVKKTSKATADMFQVGDVVGLFNEPSNEHLTALKNGKGTYNTHAGVVTSIKNGVPIISHNIHGKLYHQPYNSLTIGWIGESGAKPVVQYEDNIEKDNKKITDFIPEYVDDLTAKLKVKVDPVQVQKDIYGILKVESNLGKSTPSKNALKLNEIVKSVIGEPNDKGNMSIGPGKIKLDSLTLEEQKFLNINASSLEKPSVAVKTATYIYLKNYNMFQNYAKQNPQLQLTDDDVRLLTILSYNQGKSKLQNFGYNKNGMTFTEELQELRDLKGGNVQDISSTKYKYIPVVGQMAYDVEYPKGHESYIKRVLKYGNGF